MKKVLFCLMMLWSVSKPCEGFGQSEGLVDSVNKVIGPEYYFDPNYTPFGEFGEGEMDSVTLLIVVGMTHEKVDWIYDTWYSYKIFVLKRINKKLKVVEKSSPYYGNESYIVTKHDSLFLRSQFHGGYYEFLYKADLLTKRFELKTIEYTFRDKQYND